MIDILQGNAISKEENQLTILVGGVGFLINMNSREIEKINLNEEIKVFTKMIVREDDISLYGFLKKSERTIFSLLTTVTGIGPKVAMQVMGMYDEEEIRQFILLEDAKSLTKAPGIGKKTAERLILELKDKVSKTFTSEVPEILKINEDIFSDEALEALLSLGFSSFEAREALKNVDPSLSVDEKLKLSLKNIGR